MVNDWSLFIELLWWLHVWFLAFSCTFSVNE